jgi:hypothetical protein
MEKVYCKYCRFYDGYYCNSKSNKRTVYYGKYDRIRKKTVRDSEPDIKNSDNDCPDFEKKFIYKLGDKVKKLSKEQYEIYKTELINFLNK